MQPVNLKFWILRDMRRCVCILSIRGDMNFSSISSRSERTSGETAAVRIALGPEVILVGTLVVILDERNE